MSMVFSGFCLSILFTIGFGSENTCADGKCDNSLDIPLMTKLNAPLFAELDITGLTEELHKIIKNDVNESVSIAMQDSIDTTVRTQIANAEKSLQNRIDSRISQNETPMFFAFVAGLRLTFKGDDILNFYDVRINTGHYDKLTGIFTAPSDGYYQVSFLLMASGNSDVTYQLNKNEERYYDGYASKSNYATHGATLLMDLKLGDKIYIRHRQNSIQRIQGHKVSYFSARRI